MHAQFGGMPEGKISRDDGESAGNPVALPSENEAVSGISPNLASHPTIAIVVYLHPIY
jgi:hypothetical protein